MIKQFNYCNSNVRKRDFEVIYSIVEANQDLSLQELVDKINAALHEECVLSEIEKFNNYMIKYTYPTRGLFIKEVFDCKKNGIDKKVEKPFVRTIESMEEVISEPSPVVEQARIDSVNKMMKKYLAAKQEGKEVERDANDYYKIKKDLCKLDFDLVVDYYIAVNDLKPISVSELEQIKETIVYFMNNLSENVQFLEGLDNNDPSDVEKIKSFYVRGEKALAPVYKNNIGKLRAWKLLKIRGAFNNYKVMLENLGKPLNDHEFSKIDTLSGNRKKNLRSDSPFLVEYYDQLSDIGRVYDLYIKKINTVTDDTKKKVESVFVKKLLLTDNSVENK